MNGFVRRMQALIHKEFLQLSRDSSSLLLGIVLPIALILIIGYGISLDIRNIPTAVVLEDASPKAQDAVSFVNGSAYFSPTYVTSFREAEQLLLDRDVRVIIDVPPDFTSKLAAGEATLRVVLDGVEAATAMSTQGYIESAVSSWLLRQPGADSGARIALEARMWYNDANSSTWFFLPGLIMIIVTIIGIMLTAIVMAREWERGTFESLFVTPVRPVELVLAKIVPYFCVALLGVFLCLFLSRFLFEVPVAGSLAVLLGLTMVYLMIALGIGLVISTVTKSQFLPSVVLSGFVFDLRSTPAVVQVIGNVLPFSHYLTCLRSLFLSGTNAGLLLKQGGLLLLYGVFFIGAAFTMTRKKVE